MKRILLLALSTFMCIGLYAQKVTGVVVDADSGDGVIGASVILKGSTVGTITDVDGAFSLDVSGTNQPVLRISYLGYETIDVVVDEDNGWDLGNIELISQSLGLDEVVVMGVVDVAENRATPVAVSTVTALEIQKKTGGNTEFPDVLKNTPSVFVSNQIGGFGDSQIFTRGFDQTNTAFLLNGQPINGMEDGNMYWSNWSGMNDIANAVQIQRGLGSSKLAISSVGGTVNIITKATDKQKGGWVGFSTGNDAYLKGTVAYNTGLMENGWGVSALLTHWQGDGWAEGTFGQGQNYFLSVGYKPNDKHNFNFLITGAPQWHDQNFQKSISANLAAEENGLVDDFRKFNDNYGELNGEYLTERRNYYHKPVANLNWAWNLNERSSLSTVAYASWGRGGGTGSIGSRVRTDDGYVDFDAIMENNVSAMGASTYALRASVNNHQWYGLVTNYENQLTEKISMNVGLDVRNYTGIHFRQITDLLGADYFQVNGHAQLMDYQITSTFEADPYAALSNFAAEDERWNYDYSEVITYGGVFGQFEYVEDYMSAFIQGSVSTQSHERTDPFGYSEEEETSERVTNPGYNIKGGASYKMGENHNVFFNAGYYSRQPYHDNLYLNFGNTVNEVAENENIIGLELGYQFRSDNFEANVNLYRTKWENRVETESVFEGDTIVVDGQTFAFDEEGFLNTSNINQLHSGIEIDFATRLTSTVKLKGYLSAGTWEYEGVSKSELYNQDRDLLASESALDLDGIKVGGAAQTSWGFGVDWDITKSIDFYANYNYYSSLYGNTSPFSDDQAIELPSYGVLDIGAGYKFLLGNGDVIRLRANMYNVLDEEYIAFSRSNIAASSDASENYRGINKSNSVAWGLGRTWNVSLRYSF